MNKQQAKRIIEALLFASEKPLTIIQIKEVLEEKPPELIKTLINELKSEYTDSQRSFNIMEVAGGYQIFTDPKYADWLKKLYCKSRAEKLSHPALETLAIIAYRQPITRLEIEDIRGVSVEGVLKTLLEKSLVRISGKKKVLGRPFLYSPTRQFLELFGLQSLDDLPKLGEFQDVHLELEKREQINIKEELQIKNTNSNGGRIDGEIKEIAQESRPD